MRPTVARHPQSSSRTGEVRVPGLASIDVWRSRRRCERLSSRCSDLTQGTFDLVRGPFLLYADRMKSPVLRVQVVDNNIVVTLPGYSYAVTYYKPQGSAGLLMKYSEAKNDRRLEDDRG